MRSFLRLLAALALVAPAAAQADDSTLAPGIWTNTEDAHFAEEAGRPRPEPVLIEVGGDGRWRAVHPSGAALGGWQAGPIPGLAKQTSGSGWQVNASEIRRAAPFTCWVSARKFAAKPDGTPDWTFASGLETFDQGGCVNVPGEGIAPDVTIRLRNVTWAKGSRNKPSLVLYVHKDDPARAESYSWASPHASLIGINLRWVQASCSRADAPPPVGEAAYASLVAAGQRWKELYEAGNWQALRSLYADDAVLMTQASPKITGADAIVQFLGRLGQAGGSAVIDFAPEEATADGGYGFVTAKYRMDVTLPGQPASTVVGRSMLVYKWVDGRWLLWRDMDNFAPDATAETMAAG
ncbi:nuclear transport factor 2 family protein [Erythrobacter sp.]|uniref:YybH family protein n=1 Tax=Erythrobacter sp. TaxID=1042 RepID=UPI0025EE8C24|nr:nuclear transport factor 2 family protein [Erythrobacter sp.]